MAIKDDKEQIECSYLIEGIAIDFLQLNRTLIRGETKGVKSNLDQILVKIEKAKGYL